MGHFHGVNVCNYSSPMDGFLKCFSLELFSDQVSPAWQLFLETGKSDMHDLVFNRGARVSVEHGPFRSFQSYKLRLQIPSIWAEQNQREKKKAAETPKPAVLHRTRFWSQRPPHSQRPCAPDGFGAKDQAKDPSWVQVAIPNWRVGLLNPRECSPGAPKKGDEAQRQGTSTNPSFSESEADTKELQAFWFMASRHVVSIRDHPASHYRLEEKWKPLRHRR